jgi:hypothetical protein
MPQPAVRFAHSEQDRAQPSARHEAGGDTERDMINHRSSENKTLWMSDRSPTPYVVFPEQAFHVELFSAGGKISFGGCA